MSTHKPFRPPYFFEWSRSVPHVAQADIEGNGVGVAIAVVAIDDNNQDLHYIRLDRLDEIDLRRLTQILQSRDSARWALWDLLSQRTLLNGMNALNFFHQLVRVRTISGQNTSASGTGTRGAPLHQLFGLGSAYRGPAGAGQTAFAHHQEPVKLQEAHTQDEGGQTDIGDLSAYAPDEAAPVKRRAGRPPKAR